MIWSVFRAVSVELLGRHMRFRTEQSPGDGGSLSGVGNTLFLSLRSTIFVEFSYSTETGA
jgi:hypothetical protein